MYLVELIPRPGAKFLFGQGKRDYSSERFYSDSLGGAILSNYFINNDSIDIINKMPPITSLYFFYRAPNIYLLPFAVSKKGKRILVEKFNIDKKKLNKIKWISFMAYKSLINNNAEDIVLSERVGIISIAEEEGDITKLYDIVEERKNKISRESFTVEEDNLYNIKSITLHDGVGFYFIIDTEEIDKDLKDAILSLKLFGIGGRRTIGYGQIEDVYIKRLADVDSDIPAIFKRESKYYTNLSIVFFRDGEFDAAFSGDDSLGYIPYISGGFSTTVYGSFRRKTLIGIADGSILAKRIQGTVLDSKPDAVQSISLWRTGKAFIIPTI